MKGKFIVFEGIDGSGKGTLLQMMADKLRENNIPVVTTKEPTDGPCGQLLRQVLRGEISLSNTSTALLFAADRADHIASLHEHILEGTTVLCDRHTLSSIAYNSDSYSEEWILAINQASRSQLLPDLTILLDLPVEVALSRIAKRGDDRDLYENAEQLQQIRQNYLYWAKALLEKTATVNANQAVDDVFAQIQEIVAPLFINFEDTKEA